MPIMHSKRRLRVCFPLSRTWRLWSRVSQLKRYSTWNPLEDHTFLWPFSPKPFNFGHRCFGLYRYILTWGTLSRSSDLNSLDTLYVFCYSTIQLWHPQFIIPTMNCHHWTSFQDTQVKFLALSLIYISTHQWFSIQLSSFRFPMNMIFSFPSYVLRDNPIPYFQCLHT